MKLITISREYGVVRGHAADAIVQFAEREQVSLVVVGHHGHSRIAQLFLESTSERGVSTAIAPL